MSRSIFPKVVKDYLEIKSWDLSEEDKKGVVNVVSRSKESESLNAGNKIASSLLNVVSTAILGALFYFYQRYDESHDTEGFVKSFVNPSSNSTSISIEDETDIDEYTRNGLIVCGMALLAVSAVSVAMGSYVFAANDVANTVRNKISNMSPEDLTIALQQIEEEDLAIFKVPRGSPFVSWKMQISYAIAGLVTNFSGLPEDKQYLLFAASRVVVGELLDIADDKRKRGTVKLFEEDFLNEFSGEEKDRLRKAIKSEIESNIDKNNCSESLIRFSTELAKAFAFFGTLHNAPTSSLISEEVFASAANFGAASLVSNIVRLTAESLNNYSKIKEHSQVEELDDDVEMGANVGEGGYLPLENSEPTETEGVQVIGAPNLKISKRSKSENDLSSSQDDHFQPLMKSKSENNLTK